MDITVLFDEDTEHADLLTGFGLSLLINNQILFDTGSDGNSLIHNIRTLNIDFNAIKAVVLSHEHWDHCDGLWQLLEVLDHPTVYVCPGFSEVFVNKIAETGALVFPVEPFTHVADQIYSTGELIGDYNGNVMPEQSLVLNYSGNRAAVVCGCSHYPLSAYLRRLPQESQRIVGQRLNADTAIGGFHLRRKNDTALHVFIRSMEHLGLERVAPLHCSGSDCKAMLSMAFAENFYYLQTGNTLSL